MRCCRAPDFNGSQIPVYDLVDQLAALHLRGLQLKLSCGYWNLLFIKMWFTIPSQFQTWLEFEVSQNKVEEILSNSINCVY